ncbi:MAG TPA: hypothetical protein VHY91_14905, partial [Pirellulales bacterium]|nr:hypothetical protein [Pirellulales bacterium]
MEGIDMLDHGDYVGYEIKFFNHGAGKQFDSVSDAVIAQVWENVVVGQAVIGAQNQIARQITGAFEARQSHLTLWQYFGRLENCKGRCMNSFVEHSLTEGFFMSQRLVAVFSP